MKLLIRTTPDTELITNQDRQDDARIVQSMDAHRLAYDQDHPIKKSKGPTKKKYGFFIELSLKSSFRKGSKRKSTGGRGLPYKIARKNTAIDYVYWDDPNELVERLRLLISEQVVGHTGHVNGI